jgi:glycerate kinase
VAPSRTKPSQGIPQRLLIASGPFATGLPALRVAAAIGRGVEAAGRPAPDLYPIEPSADGAGGAVALLDGDFDKRLRAARAVVVAWVRLEERTLSASVAFEIATRARQGGVPAYAVTAANALDRFDARILDLQLILEARDTRQLAAAGRRLAELA